jgi:hypothetical protein
MADEPITPVKKDSSKNLFIFSGVAVILIIIAFFGGIQYQKGQTPPKTTKASAVGSRGGFGGGQRRGGFGAVTAISTTSITVQNSRTGTSQTYSIGSDTTVSNMGQTGSVSDIKTGDQVIIQPSTTDATHAATIRLGGFGGGATGAPSGSTSTD